MSKLGKGVKVLIGQVCLTRAPNVLETVLGSCIGLVIYDPVDGIAGMAHVLLPSSSGRAPADLPGKYADNAVECIVASLKKQGGQASRFKAKFTGGANMFSNQRKDGRIDIGGMNIAEVTKQLKAHGITIISSDVGGNCGRRALFDPKTFEYIIEDFSNNRRVI